MTKLHENKKLQLIFGLLAGICFGFLLQKGKVTKYEIILNQLRLMDFTVLKVMLSSVIVTMLGISYIYPKKKIKLHVKKGSVKNSVIGGLIFGAGFGILGYCPGTIAGAIGNGSIDGLTGGIAGILLGSGLFASMYSKLVDSDIITEDRFSGFSLFDHINGSPFKVTIPFSIFLIVVMRFLN